MSVSYISNKNKRYSWKGKGESKEKREGIREKRNEGKIEGRQKEGRSEERREEEKERKLREITQCKLM